MKKNKKKYLVLVALLLILVIALEYSGVLTNIKEGISSFIDEKLNDQDYLALANDGSLVSDSDLSSLSDSGITGEDYTFDTTYYPYYGMLSEAQQVVYAQTYANAYSLSTTFIPSKTLSVSQVNEVIEAVYNDHPELFWIETSYSYKYTSTGNCVQVTLNFNSLANNIEQAKNYFNAKANAIINKAKTLSSNYEKEKYVHDAIIASASYNENAAMTQSAYSALVNGKTVCAGYARAFQYIMIQLNIPTYFVVGYASENHGWNLVKLSDGYYNVDLTWDDDASDSYAYFNKTDADFASTHTRTGLSLNLPKAYGTLYRNSSNTSTQVIYYTDESPGDDTSSTTNETNITSSYDQTSDEEETTLNQNSVQEDEAQISEPVREENENYVHVEQTQGTQKNKQKEINSSVEE